MYLVINLVVVDTFVGGFGITHVWLLGSGCNFCSDQLPILLGYQCLVSFNAISISNKPCCYFLRANACNVSSIFKHRLIKKKTFGAAIRLDYTWNLCMNNDYQITPHTYLIYKTETDGNQRVKKGSFGDGRSNAPFLKLKSGPFLLCS